ncbi:MAG: hypothetical protein H6715_03915 [Myxococcales bacterium]|nr:hypothetical protein [Myxococcales bacterium]MCB9708651.1 hypothetical protein [Myxococcales bacterium]
MFDAVEPENCAIENPATCGSDLCINLDTDTQHCGGCFLSCSSGELCS